MAKRDDNSGFIYHWIKAVPFTRGMHEDYASAFDVLMEIIDDGCIRAGLTMEKGGHECICFTESTKRAINNDTSKYQPFGFQYSKRSIFNAGGRPAIYSPIADKDFLHQCLHWRFMPFDLSSSSGNGGFGIDFTWEREWRLNEPKLYVQNAEAIYVPNNYYRDLLIKRTDEIINDSISSNPDDIYYRYPDPGVEDYFHDVQSKIDVLSQY